jgi:hypothetical protein
MKTPGTMTNTDIHQLLSAKALSFAIQLSMNMLPIPLAEVKETNVLRGYKTGWDSSVRVSLQQI